MLQEAASTPFLNSSSSSSSLNSSEADKSRIEARSRQIITRVIRDRTVAKLKELSENAQFSERVMKYHERVNKQIFQLMDELKKKV